MVARALTIAGSDSGGGAGIQADLKTFTVLRVYGMTAITAITVQDTRAVHSVHPLPATLVGQQIERVVDDIGLDAAKTGMLVNAAIIDVVAAVIRRQRICPLVVDPVLLAGTGAPLLDTDARSVLLRELFPLATLITPNVPEAEALTGMPIRTRADMRAAARRLLDTGARAVLLKGGHLDDPDAVDIFDDGVEPRELVTPRLQARHTHGTGCQLSAAITAYLARGCALRLAVEEAKQFITTAIRCGLAIGHGTGPANPMAWLETHSSR